MCIGNKDGGDDAIGHYVFKVCEKQKPNGVIAVDCGMTPENYTSLVKQHKPKSLVLIDAADMGLPIGEMRRIPKEKVGSFNFSTHALSLSLLITYLEPEVSDIVFIGIQPGRLSGALSDVVRRTGEAFVRLLKEHKLHVIPTL